MSDDSSVTRRQMLAAGGTAAALALAGCTAEEDGAGTESDGQGLAPPTTPPVPEDQYWAYVVESLDYQNAALAQLLEESG